ncbi:hypothetical protein FQN57_007107 [Myotisia sp. PD_48]|nr:hypothetical protein FQN57_007107 [Myotisia sp. PD_48]
MTMDTFNQGNQQGDLIASSSEEILPRIAEVWSCPRAHLDQMPHNLLLPPHCRAQRAEAVTAFVNVPNAAAGAGLANQKAANEAAYQKTRHAEMQRWRNRIRQWEIGFLRHEWPGNEAIFPPGTTNLTVSATHLTKTRDNCRCITQKTSLHDVAHIFPYFLRVYNGKDTLNKKDRLKTAFVTLHSVKETPVKKATPKKSRPKTAAVRKNLPRKAAKHLQIELSSSESSQGEVDIPAKAKKSRKGSAMTVIEEKTSPASWAGRLFSLF